MGRDKHELLFICRPDGTVRADTVESGNECESIVDVTLQDLAPMIGKVIDRENTVDVSQRPQDPDIRINKQQV